MKIFRFLKKWCDSKKFLGVLRILFKLYLILNEFNIGSFIRSRNVMANLETTGSGEKIFDAGCGVGLYSLRMAQKGTYVVGGDISPLFKYSKLLGDAKLLKSLDFILMDLNYIPIKSETFDEIICVDVLEHIENDERVIAEFSRILKKDGELLIHVPNLKRLAKLKPNERAASIQLERECFGHVRSGYTLEQLQSLLQKSNIKVDNFTYTFGFWSQVAGRVSSIFRGSGIIFPLLFFLALLDKFSNNNEYNGGILIRGKRIDSTTRNGPRGA